MVIDDRSNEPALMTAGTWRDRKGSMEVMSGRTWTYHGMSHKAMRTRTSVLHRFWRDHISDEHGRRGKKPPNAPAVPKTTFSYAMTAMDKVGGWSEEEWVGSKLAACMWICTEAVLCDGRRRPPQDLRRMLRIIMDCVSWACADFIVGTQVGDGAQRSLQKIWKQSTWRLSSHLTCPLTESTRTRTCLLRAVSDAPDKDWNHEEELKGWDLDNIRSCHLTVSVAMHLWVRKEKTEGQWDKCFDNVFWFHT